MMSRSEEVSDPIPTPLARAARILSAFEGRRPSLTLTDVVQSSGLSQTTVHRLMSQLVELGWLERDGRDYRVGLRLLELGAFASRYSRLRQAALPFLISLHQTTGLWVQLTAREGPEIVVLEQIGDPLHSALPFHTGSRLPAHCTASGKALLAFSGAADEPLLTREPPARTRSTLTRPDAMLAELAEVRSAGVAFDRRECFDDVTCVAAPLRGAGWVLAAISVSQVGEPADLGPLAPQVVRYAEAVWSSVFGRGGDSGVDWPESGL